MHAHVFIEKYSYTMESGIRTYVNTIYIHTREYFVSLFHETARKSTVLWFTVTASFRNDNDFIYF
jgi:hypothetical protein